MTPRHEIAREMVDQAFGDWARDWSLFLDTSDVLVSVPRAAVEGLKRRVAGLIAAVMPEESS